MGRTLVIAALLLGLAACEATATPLPVALEPTSAPSPTAPVVTLRYGLSPEAYDYWSAELPGGAVTFDPRTESAAAFDVAVALGVFPNMVPAETMIVVKLRLDPSLAPLDDPEVTRLVLQAFHPTLAVQALADLGVVAPADVGAPGDPAVTRAALANAGYPDGLPLNLAAHAPGAERLPRMVQPYGIDLRLQEISGVPSALHGSIVGQTTWTESDSAGYQELYQVPISVYHRDDLALHFTETGLPDAGT